jgi:hypothetical protein
VNYILTFEHKLTGQNTKTFMSGKLKVNVKYLNEPSDKAIENFNIEINKILHKL